MDDNSIDENELFVRKRDLNQLFLIDSEFASMIHEFFL